MSEGGLGVPQDSLFWENHPWFLPSSDNSAGSDGNKTKQPESDPAPPKEKKRSRASGTQKNADKGRDGELENEGKDGAGGGGGGGELDHGMHIWTERERRKRMRDMFSNLHALLPQLPPKADKSSIVDEAVNYIKTLQHTLQTLQRRRLERFQEAFGVNFEPVGTLAQHQQSLAVDTRESFLADHSSSVNLQGAASTTVAPSNNPLLLSQFPVAFQTWTSSNVVLNICGNVAQISICSPRKAGLLTTVCSVLEKYNLEVLSAHVSSDQHRSIYMIQFQAQASGVADQYLETIPVEEIYKQAAAEIMLWVSS